MSLTLLTDLSEHAAHHTRLIQDGEQTTLMCVTCARNLLEFQPELRDYLIEVNVKQVAETLQDPEDTPALAGRYEYQVEAVSREAAEELGLDEFHESVAIGCLEDWEITPETTLLLPTRSLAELRYMADGTAEPMSDEEAFERIHATLDGVEWGTDTIEFVGLLVEATGRQIREPDELDEE